jgi:hypothetical protein
MLPARLPHRRVTAFFVVVSLLFAQLALASYVCPGSAGAIAMAEAMAAGEPCQGMDTAQPVLCHQSAAASTPTLEIAKLAAPAAPNAARVLVVPLALEPDRAIALPFEATSQARPPPDPLFLATLRLRV